jgi:spermidine/putrescine transport system permease protein
VSVAVDGRPGWGWQAIKAFTVLVYLFMFAPIAVTVLLSFNAAQFGGFPMTGLSLHWFVTLAGNDMVLRAFRASLGLGLLTAAICTVLGILAAMALVRYEFPGKEWVNTLIVAPVLVPETVLAVGLLLFIRWLGQPRTFLLLLAGHVMLSLPYVVLVVQARLIGIKRVYEEAALSLGANRLATFHEITLPLLMPAIVAGLLLAFTISFDNVTATMFWRPAGMETMPTQIYSMLRHSISPEINALGTVMILVTVGLPILGGGLARALARGPR